MNINNSVSNIKGIGAKAEANLAKLNIRTIGDLLLHFPRDYKRYEDAVDISCKDYDEQKAFAYDVHITESAKLIKRGKGSIVLLNIRSKGETVEVMWYHSPFIRSQLHSGDRIILFGKISKKGNRRIMAHPEIYTYAKYEELRGTMQPIYDLTEGITQNFLSKYIRQVLEAGLMLNDPLPMSLRSEYHLTEFNYALTQIHFPDNYETLIDARKRLVFEEFFIFALSLKLLKQDKHKIENAFPINIDKKKEVESFIDSLPYKLTNAQIRVWHEIAYDLESPHVMNRLVQGDVGSGKTMIATLAMLYNSLSGYQSCMMAPTEVLAKQHYENLCSMLGNIGIRLTLLTGSMTAKQKREAYECIRSHQTDIIIGTQAVFQEKVEYDNLTLIITDEQHRFGVRQRELLAKKNQKSEPHVLVMSATPIPRTLAIILYSDLDISVVDEKPSNRLPIKNCVVGTSYRQTAYKFMKSQIDQGHQIYIICPMVEESENFEAEDVISYTQQLKKVFPKEINITYLHGKMKSDEKNDIMESFSNGDIHILVSTTVIEVGVDVANATVMMIENSERFGLAQLHQLRGRVGRGKDQSYCIFMYGQDNQKIKERLDIMLKTNDGFKIASEDLKLRGPGDMFGIRQSGVMNFKIADVMNDSNILLEAGKAAENVLKNDPKLEENSNYYLKEKVEIFMQGNSEQIIL